jgi:hypothetical protein
MTTKKKINYTSSTSKFCIAGIFIPGFTAIAILGLQMGIGLLGIECAKAWTILWTITTIGAVAAPILFVRLMNKKILEGYILTTDKLLIFNIIEYTFIQCTLASLFTNGKTLCYVSDGQNGIEFAFTGWMALPFLAALSFLFDKIRDRKIEELKSDESTT